jgi:hypothetical protein
MANVLQTWKRHSLGRDWTVRFLSDGSASFFDASTSQYIHLPKSSVDTLRSAFRAEREDA